LSTAVRAQEADALRARMRDADDRLIATAFVLAETREQLLSLIAQRHPDPVARIHAFLDEAGVFESDEEGSAAVAHALADGADAEGAIEKLLAQYGQGSIDPDEVREYCRRSPMGVLCRFSVDS
jgi:hypothetical protein